MSVTIQAPVFGMPWLSRAVRLDGTIVGRVDKNMDNEQWQFTHSTDSRKDYGPCLTQREIKDYVDEERWFKQGGC